MVVLMALVFEQTLRTCGGMEHIDTANPNYSKVRGAGTLSEATKLRVQG